MCTGGCRTDDDNFETSSLAPSLTPLHSGPCSFLSNVKYTEALTFISVLGVPTTALVIIRIYILQTLCVGRYPTLGGKESI